jgi:hypothetical protein
MAGCEVFRTNVAPFRWNTSFPNARFASFTPSALSSNEVTANHDNGWGGIGPTMEPSHAMFSAEASHKC